MCVNGHERQSATDCFLVPERGHSPLPEQQTLEDRAHIIRREH